MSIPNNQVSTVPHYAAWREVVRQRGELLRDYEVAGVAINDGTQGMQVKQWIARVDVELFHGGSVIESRLQVSGDNGLNWTTLLTRSAIRVVEICLAFDNNMNPFLGFVEESGDAYRWWYDSTLPGQVLTELPAGIRSLRSCIDEKRRPLQADTDICFFYIRGGNMYVSYQRERFETEHLLATGVGTSERLIAVQMNVLNRLQWTIEGGGEEDWRLPDVIEDLALRANLPPSRLNLSLMNYAKIVRGYTVGNAYQCSGILQTLSSVFFFDPANANGKLSFVPRGRDAVATILDEDHIDDTEDQDADSQSRRQDSIGIPRVLHLNYYDVAGGLNTDKQRSERPEGTRADGEQSLQTSVVMSADEAASVVHITHGLMAVQQKGELSFALPDNWLRLTESDPVFVQSDNKIVRTILTRVEIDDGEQRYKAIRDRQSLYTTQVQGIPAAPVARPPSSVAGPTIVEFLDIPILRDTHDQLGFYMAVSGILPAWPGALVEMSLDAGQTYVDSQSTRSSSVIGELTTALGAHPHEYSDDTNSCQVQIKTPNALLENTDLAGMMNRKNRALIGNEMVNFADADEVSPGVWELSNWLRGRKGTTAAAHAIGERFVLLNTAMFIPADLAWLNRTLTFRATTFGRPVDEATIIGAIFTGQSQTERKPAYLQARRAGSDVIASWQGVGRLGGGVNIAMGAYFSGYRLTLTDGTTTQTFDIAGNTYTGSLAAFTGPVSVRVQQRNQLTGLGPQIEIII